LRRLQTWTASSPLPDPIDKHQETLERTAADLPPFSTGRVLSTDKAVFAVASEPDPLRALSGSTRAEAELEGELVRPNSDVPQVAPQGGLTPLINISNRSGALLTAMWKPAAITLQSTGSSGVTIHLRDAALMDSAPMAADLPTQDRHGKAVSKTVRQLDTMAYGLPSANLHADDNRDRSEPAARQLPRGTVKVTAAALGVGGAVGLWRATGLAASTIASRPLWQQFDPIPLLPGADEEFPQASAGGEDRDSDAEFQRDEVAAGQLIDEAQAWRGSLL
jgi:hypothetical protein